MKLRMEQGAGLEYITFSCSSCKRKPWTEHIARADKDFVMCDCGKKASPHPMPKGKAK